VNWWVFVASPAWASIAERGGRLVDEDDAVAMLANTGLEDT